MANPIYKIYVKTSNVIARSPVCKKLLNYVYPVIQPIMQKANTFYISTSDFLFLQHKNGVFIRPDMIVRYMFLEQHYGKADFSLDAVSIYEKMQKPRQKNNTAQFMTEKFYRLIESYEKIGYDSSSAVSVDKNLLIRDGSHRTAFALYFDLPAIPVNRTNNALPTDYKNDLFDKAGFTDEEKQCIYNKLSQLLDKHNQPIRIVLPCDAENCIDNICADLELFGKIVGVQKHLCDSNQYNDLCKAMNKTKNIHAKAENPVYIVSLKLNSVAYAPLDNPKKPVIQATNDIKKLLASKYISAADAAFDKVAVPCNFMENSNIVKILKSAENLYAKL
ncbi:MAG: hypothetical protein IJN69_05945 [Oscillospiraceae bacterium]|nr:hypothetical protein [Oscillospiraceae bacterium]